MSYSEWSSSQKSHFRHLTEDARLLLSPRMSLVLLRLLRLTGLWDVRDCLLELLKISAGGLVSRLRGMAGMLVLRLL